MNSTPATPSAQNSDSKPNICSFDIFFRHTEILHQLSVFVCSQVIFGLFQLNQIRFFPKAHNCIHAKINSPIMFSGLNFLKKDDIGSDDFFAGAIANE